MTRSRLPFYAAILLAGIGLLLLFSPLLHLLSTAPRTPHHHAATVSIVVSLPVVGIILLYLAVFVYRLRLLAVIVASGLSLLVLAYLAVRASHSLVLGPLALLTALYLLAIGFSYQRYSFKNNLEGLPQYLPRLIGAALAGFLYGFLVFFAFGPDLFHAQFSPSQSADLAVDSLTGFSGSIDVPTHLGQLFISSLGGVGITLFTLLLGLLFRPLRLKPWSGDQLDREEAAAIIRAHSTSSEDFFKLWPHDKQYFFAPDRNAFLAYHQSGRTAIILGDPTGDPAAFDELVHRFTEYCTALGWTVVVVNATEAGQPLYESEGLSALAIGSEGVVDINDFMTVTIHNKHFRYVANKGRRDKLAVEEWQELGDERIAELRHISNAWLSRSGRREYGFFMGYFDPRYLRQCRIFSLHQNGRLVAYVNLIPSFYKGHASLDQFRSATDKSPVVMHFLLMKVLEQLSTEKTTTLNIGLSPLSSEASYDTPKLSQAVRNLVRLLGAPYYSFQGLEQFKGKFKPHWVPRSLFYTGPPTRLIRIARDLDRVASYGRHGDLQAYISIAAGLIVLTLGLYLFLG